MIKFLNKYLLTEFALLIIALLARFLIMKLFFVWGIIESALRWELRQYMKSCAYITDVEGNVKGKYILNFLMVKKGGHSHGDPLESISYAIGRSKHLSKQKPFGVFIDQQLLERCEDDHCLKAVKNLDCQILTRIMYLN